MTRIDFYVSERPGQSDLIACRLTEKAYQRGLRVLVHCPDEARRNRLDDLLWTFRQGSFVPHERLGASPTPDAPVLIGDADEAGEGEGDVLINLADEIPTTFARHRRVLEIVDGDPARKAAARARYKFYKDRGYPLQTHTL